LFTSRAEYRLLLRQDNADLRLASLGYDIGLVSRADYERVCRLREEIDRGRSFLRGRRQHGQSFWELLRRPDVDFADLPAHPEWSARACEQLEIEALYEGYVERQRAQIDSLSRLESQPIPADFDYAIRGIRTEARLKLEKQRPRNLGQASRIDGVTPAEIALLQVHLKRHAAASSADT
jgi:tRNA uridine 5-carboxymethylaminomethyl modification enzyme